MIPRNSRRNIATIQPPTYEEPPSYDESNVWHQSEQKVGKALVLINLIKSEIF